MFMILVLFQCDAIAVDDIAVDDILEIHKYLMKNNNMIKKFVWVY